MSIHELTESEYDKAGDFYINWLDKNVLNCQINCLADNKTVSSFGLTSFAQPLRGFGHGKSYLTWGNGIQRSNEDKIIYKK